MNQEQRLAKVQLTTISDTLNGVWRELKFARKSIKDLEENQRATYERLAENERLLVEGHRHHS